ncbi:hypothetical protein [Aeromonas piscicola]|uniref:hypothetical protein n=1 Tax=Aeromonas piscicola TaxID=600645 RepID=UPI0028E3DDD7|nr:hypothetical protein [Aeromonas piscicola]
MRPYLVCCFLMITLYPVGIDLYLVALPEIGVALEASAAQLYTAFSAYLSGGQLADRYDRKLVILRWRPHLCAGLAACRQRRLDHGS